MKRHQILQLFNCNQTELADLLGYTPNAITQWGSEKDIPKEPYLRLRHEIAPHLPWPDKRESVFTNSNSSLAVRALIALHCAGYLFVCAA